MAASTASKAAEARTDQSQNALALLRAKAPMTESVTVVVDDEGTTVELVFKSVGRKRYNEILEAHTTEPEKAEEGAEEEPEPELDFSAFILQLVTESLVEPEGATLDDVTYWYDSWNGTEFDLVAGAAMKVNGGSRVGPTVKG